MSSQRRVYERTIAFLIDRQGNYPTPDVTRVFNDFHPEELGELATGQDHALDGLYPISATLFQSFLNKADLDMLCPEFTELWEAAINVNGKKTSFSLNQLDPTGFLKNWANAALHDIYQFFQRIDPQTQKTYLQRMMDEAFPAEAGSSALYKEKTQHFVRGYLSIFSQALTRWTIEALRARYEFDPSWPGKEFYLSLYYTEVLEVLLDAIPFDPEKLTPRNKTEKLKEAAIKIVQDFEFKVQEEDKGISEWANETIKDFYYNHFYHVSSKTGMFRWQEEVYKLKPQHLRLYEFFNMEEESFRQNTLVAFVDRLVEKEQLDKNILSGIVDYYERMIYDGYSDTRDADYRELKEVLHDVYKLVTKKQEIKEMGTTAASVLEASNSLVMTHAKNFYSSPRPHSPREVQDLKQCCEEVMGVEAEQFLKTHPDRSIAEEWADVIKEMVAKIKKIIAGIAERQHILLAAIFRSTRAETKLGTSMKSTKLLKAADKPKPSHKASSPAA